ncbi:MAG TPA: Gfo/Idh/MocA family oxidoreductase [Vicinamibacterales bacterium]|nr:Gfo/Idh/MocA family oxidoreductase [Vicinamibacterales bacterium]
MKRIGMGIVGAGFVGPHHIDAVRRLGYVDVVAVAGSSQASADKKAEAVGARKAYGGYEALLNDPDIQVVHNATPNYLHYPVNAAAIAKGKHVVSDKPLAMTAAEAKKLLDQATKAGVVHAVTFNYRGNPLVQQARNMIARGELGKPHFLVGQYLQDWLLKDTDYSWRLEPDKGGASSALGDIGSHWCDLAQHISGLRITHVLGDITTVIPKRKKPLGSREAFAAADANQKVEEVDIKVEDLASVLLRFDNGAKGCFSVGQVCAGHKNDLELEICGSKTSLKWRQEHQNELLIGHRDKPNEILQKDPSLIDQAAGKYAHLPGGHQEAWADAFANLMRDIYGFIAEGKKPSDPHPPAFATFEDGYRANCIVEAILQSASKGSAWTKVDY